MSVFVQIARDACKGMPHCPTNLALSQRNWIRFMMGEPYEEPSSNFLLDKTGDCKEEDVENLLKKSQPGTVAKTTSKDLSALEYFLKLWLKNDKDAFMKTINSTLNGKYPSIPKSYNDPFDFYSEYIVLYSLIDFKKKIYLDYKGNSDKEWSVYFTKCIKSLAREIFLPEEKRQRLVTSSTFIYKSFPNETIMLFSENADVSCIKDKLVELKNNKNKKVVACFAPNPGLKFECKEELFESEESLELSLVIKNFCIRSEEIFYADEYQDGQFISSELFRDCKHLVKVDLSDKVKVVESDCFKGCSSLKTLVASTNHLIVGERNYPFIIKSRPTNKVIHVEPDWGRIASSDPSVNNFGLDSESQSTDRNTDSNQDTSHFGILNEGRKDWDNEDEFKGDNEENLTIDIGEVIAKTTQTIDNINEDGKKSFYLQLMPKKLHSDILYYTYYGLPNDFEPSHHFIPDVHGNTTLNDVRYYLTRVNPDYQGVSWYSEKQRAHEKLKRIYIVFETLQDWTLSKSNKIKEANALFFSNRRSSRALKWFIQLLQGCSYAKITRMEQENNQEIEEQNIRNAISRVFDTLYEFINRS